MAKQKYERKKVISICGRLDVDDNGTYFITVTDKDNIETFYLKDIIDEMCGSVVNIVSDDEY